MRGPEMLTSDKGHGRTSLRSTRLSASNTVSLHQFPSTYGRRTSREPREPRSGHTIVDAPLAATVAATSAPTATAAPQAARVELAISDDAFTPKTLSVSAGATVIWNRSGTHPHTVTADDASFESGILRAGHGFEHTFSQPDTFASTATSTAGPAESG